MNLASQQLSWQWQPLTTASAGFLPRARLHFVVHTSPQVPPARLLRQTHSSQILVDEPASPQASFDGFVATHKPIEPIAIQTADCLPVILYHEATGLHSILHAGWRGLAAGILPQAVSIMHKRFRVPASELQAVLGPCICPRCYEVGEDLWPAFAGGPCGIPTEGLLRCFTRIQAQKYLLDLRLAAALSLWVAGVQSEKMTVVDVCTFESQELPSYRRDGASGRRILTWMTRT